MRRFAVLFCAVAWIAVSPSIAVNKYSAEANLPKSEPSDFRNLNKPFRMSKLNILWTKAQIRLTEPKLKSLYSDLQIQDKEELGLKRMKSDGLDKDGLKEADTRKKLLNIMSAYGLLEHFEDVESKLKLKEHGSFNEASEDYINKSLFKDKKLNKLWYKAELAGFTTEELQALKEEFTHHQDKIDQYYSILSDMENDRTDDIENAMNEEEMDSFNDVNNNLSSDNSVNRGTKTKADILREKHLELRDDYDRLFRLSAKGPWSQDFVEPKVQQLWQAALKGDFKPNEIESLRVELLHYESRLLKLRHLQAEHVSNKEMNSQIAKDIPRKEFIQMKDALKKHMRKVEKLHLDLETRIMGRHSEL